MKSKKRLNNGINVYTIQETKFNEVYATVRVIFPMEKRTNTIANILTRMMGDRLQSNPTKQSITARHDALYGAKMSALTYSCGIYQVIDLSVRTISGRFVEDNLQQDQLDLVADMLFEPLLNEETFSEAVKNLKQSHMRVKENTSQYAITESFKYVGKNQVFGLSAMGELQDVDTISLDDVKSFHTLCVSQFAKEIYVAGDFQNELNYAAFEKAQSIKIGIAQSFTHIANGYHEVHHQGSQTELVLLYETDIVPGHDLYYAYLVMVAYLGQSPSSLLFQNVREKHSLCYSIYAARHIFDGVLYISTGINDKNTDKAIQLIQEQFTIMKTESLDIESAKQYLILQMEGTSEHLRRIVDHEFRNNLIQHDDSVEMIQSALNEVTQEQVKEVLDHISEGFIYAYRGDDHE
ncbi:MAG: insulinase family protein [Erysipelothrix sp.]